MLNFLKKLFGLNSEPTKEAPYKVEAPVMETVQPVEKAPEPAKCGCGRSPTGFCVGLHKLSEAEWTVHADNPQKPVAKEEKPKAKAPRAAKPKAAKPAKATKPKAPKKPKATPAA